MNMLKPSEVAARCRVDVERVLAWINAKELRAANVATKATSKKPRWVVAESELIRFLESRTAPTTTQSQQSEPKPTRRARVSKKPTKYF